MKSAVKNFMTPLPHTIGETISLKKAKELMEQYDCHHLPVLNGGQIIGLLSSHDLSLMLLTPKGADSTVKDFMSLSPYTVDPNQSIKEVATAMLEQRISSAIVRAKDDQPWGIFTSTDALKALATLL